MKQGPYRLLIVDDSPEVRRSIIDIVEPDGRFEVVGEAEQGAQALRMVSELEPDVISLDIVMPGMNGITALKHLMINRPTPTVMVSSLTREGEESSMEALRFGAVTFVPKLSRLEERDLSQQADDIVTKLLWAAQVEVEAIRYIRAYPSTEMQGIGGPCRTVAAIGAHEGGYSALMKIIPRLKPAPDIGWIVVLYEPGRYVDAFVEYLERYSTLSIRRAEDGAPLVGGVCHIAAGDDYVTLRHDGNGHALHVHPAPFDSQKGSINRVFFSLAEVMQQHSVGVVLSGSGDDGAEGMAEIDRVGGTVIVQDPRSCLVKEMAENIIALNPSIRVIPDGHIADEMSAMMG